MTAIMSRASCMSLILSIWIAEAVEREGLRVRLALQFIEYFINVTMKKIFHHEIIAKFIEILNVLYRK